MEWISVEYELPEKVAGSIYSIRVLAVDIEDGCIFISTFVNETKSWHYYYKAPSGIINLITHWMPLPQPPKE